MIIEVFRSEGEKLKNVEVLETPIASVRILHETHEEDIFDPRVMEGADLYCVEQTGSPAYKAAGVETFSQQMEFMGARQPLYEYAIKHTIPVSLVDSMVPVSFNKGILNSHATNVSRRLVVAGALSGGVLGLMGLNTARHKFTPAMSSPSVPPAVPNGQVEPSPPPPQQKDIIDKAIEAVALPTLAYFLACTTPKLLDPALMISVAFGLKDGEINITTLRYTAWRATVRLRKFMDPDEFSYFTEVRDMVMALKTVTAIEERAKKTGKKPTVVLNIGSAHSHHMKEYLAMSQQVLAARIYRAAKELNIIEIVQDDIAKSASGVWDEAKKKWAVDANPHPELERVFAAAKDAK